MRARVVTFDLFSALIDSRRGGSAAFSELGQRRGWGVSGTVVYDTWDRCNKALHARVTRWVPFTVLAAEALGGTYRELGLDGEPERDAARVLSTVGTWPLWPDVAEGLPALSRDHRVGLLSNVDDALFRQTRAAPLIDPGLAMTSERLGAYKPHPDLYRRAVAAVGPMVHVATSARDVRGALEAGIAVVRLRRPGHHLDPDGPRPTHEATSWNDLPALLESAGAGRDGPDA